MSCLQCTKLACNKLYCHIINEQNSETPIFPHGISYPSHYVFGVNNTNSIDLTFDMLSEHVIERKLTQLQISGRLESLIIKSSKFPNISCLRNCTTLKILNIQGYTENAQRAPGSNQIIEYLSEPSSIEHLIIKPSRNICRALFKNTWLKSIELYVYLTSFNTICELIKQNTTLESIIIHGYIQKKDYHNLLNTLTINDTLRYVFIDGCDSIIDFQFHRLQRNTALFSFAMPLFLNNTITLEDNDRMLQILNRNRKKYTMGCIIDFIIALWSVSHGIHGHIPPYIYVEIFLWTNYPTCSYGFISRSIIKVYESCKTIKLI